MRLLRICQMLLSAFCAQAARCPSLLQGFWRVIAATLVVLGAVLAPAAAHAFDPFVIKDIRAEGIQRTEAGTVFSYLPVKVGDTFNDEKAAESIKALFATGFFKDVRVEVEGDVLVVTVDERPAIATVDLTGTKAFDKEAIKKSLKETGMAEGRIFDRAVLDKAEQELKRQYLSKGLYGMQVKTTVTPLERNRVGIVLAVDEGEIARIKRINLVGVTAFPESDLLDQLALAKSGWMSWYSKDDQYSKQKLSADLETLRSFYFNRGYLEYNLESTQVSITPDKQDIYISATIREGKKYTVSDIKMGGNTVLPPTDLLRLVQLKPGEVFNGEKMAASTKKIQERLGNEGYAFANANAAPEIDRDKQTVAFTIFIDPGRRVYVRRVNVAGNTRTRDEVVRREMRQIEGAYYDGEKIAESKKRIDRLGYFSNAEIETPAVAGTPDQVDVNVRITEKPTGQLLLGAGFSSAEKVVLQTSISQANVFGSGNTIGAAISTSRSNKTYSLSQTNPYFTVDGISRSFSIYHRDFNAAALNAGDYKTTSTGFSVGFGYPVTPIDTLIFSLAPDVTSYAVGSAPPLSIANYVATFGSSVTSLATTATWLRDTRDSASYTRNGRFLNSSIEVGLPGGSVQYARVSVADRWFFPISTNTTLFLRGDIGVARSIGSKPLPSFKKFFGGGIGSVRGYETNTLGPRDTDLSILGGERRVSGTAELLFPFPGLARDRSVRLLTFVDAGQVSGPGALSGGGVRASTGFGLDWNSPFGPLRFSFAKPMNPKENDRLQRLQFTAGTTF